jgi:hypothetical protein
MTYNQIKHKYFIIALAMLDEGSTIQEIEYYIKHFEKHEEFEKCAGLLKAVNLIKRETLINIEEMKIIEK